ncbi:MAG TPA: anti-sigma factor domain-containing protein [Firmicutes bacterium]|nr:anti-sigma factor domain-containing protein [Bacillota bacterium]
MRGVERESGIVLETKGRTVILLTRNGEFRRAAIAGRVPDIGEEIAIPRSEIYAHARDAIFRWPAFRVAAVAVVALVAFILSRTLGHDLQGWFKSRGTVQAPPAIVAYVSVDINPSVELALDASTVVVRTRSFNKDGEKLLAAANVVGKKATEAVEVLTEKAIDEHFIDNRSPGGIILLAVTPSGGANLDDLGEELRRSAGLVLARRGVQVASIEALTVDKACRDEAARKGLSAGRFALVEKAREAGLRIGIEDVRGGRIGDVMAHAGVNLHDLLAASKSAFVALHDEGKPGGVMHSPAGPRPPEVAIFMKTRTSVAGVPKDPVAGGIKGMKGAPAIKDAPAIKGARAAPGSEAGVEIGRMAGPSPAKEMRLTLSGLKTPPPLGRTNQPAAVVHPDPASTEIDRKPGSTGVAGLSLTGGKPGSGPGQGAGQEQQPGDSPAHTVTLASAPGAIGIGATKGARMGVTPGQAEMVERAEKDLQAEAGPESDVLPGGESKGLKVSDLTLSKAAGMSIKDNNNQDKGEDNDKDKGKDQADKAKDKNESKDESKDKVEGDKDKVKPE